MRLLNEMTAWANHIREAEVSGDRDLVRRALVMLPFYYKQTGRTAELGAVCRRLANPGPPC